MREKALNRRFGTRPACHGWNVLIGRRRERPQADWPDVRSRPAWREREGVTPKKPAFFVEPLEEEDVSLAALNKIRLQEILHIRTFWNPKTDRRRFSTQGNEVLKANFDQADCGETLGLLECTFFSGISILRVFSISIAL